jgi:hypothetical protein
VVIVAAFLVAVRCRDDDHLVAQIEPARKKVRRMSRGSLHMTAATTIRSPSWQF